MFSKIGKAISSAAKSAYNWVSGVSNKVANTLQKANPNTYTASVVNAGLNPNKTVYYDNSGRKYQTNTINAVQVPSSVGPVGSASYNQFIASNPQGTSITDVTYGRQLPVNISAGSIKPSSISAAGGGSNQNLSSNLDLSGFNYNAFAPVTISAKSLGAQTSGTGTLSGTGGIGVTQPVTINNAPISTAVGRVDNTKLASGMYGYKYNPTTGQYEEVQAQPEQTIDAKIQKELDFYKKYLGDKQSVYDDPEVIRATQQRRQIQESLKGPTDQLNAIIAKQNQDLLQLRQTGSQEGVTEAVYGGQQNAINYNAAIRALPLQAQLASIQGDLKLSQDYLNELTQIKQDQINKQYEANKNQFEMIKGILTKEDQRAYDELTKTNDRVYKEQQDLINYQAEAISNIYEDYGANVPQSVINRINNARNKQEVVTAAGQYLAKSTTTGQTYNTSQEKVIDSINSSVANDFGYKAVNSARSFADGTISALSQKTGLGDVAAINQFQKVIDEGAVTREQDVRLVQGAQNLAASLKLKIKKLQKGDQLTETQREQMKKTVLDLYQAKVENLISNPYIQSQILKAQRLGISADDTILGQLGAFNAEQTTGTTEGSTKVWNGVTYKVVNGVWTPQ